MRLLYSLWFFSFRQGVLEYIERYGVIKMKDLRCKTKIPSNDFILSDVKYDLKDEKLISFTSEKVIFSPMHLFNGIIGAKSECLLRESVVERITEAANSLPKGYYLKIYDAWRPLKLQEELYRKYQCINKYFTEP